jgi:peptidoglycan/LPS O-acetylase OafA/YrhL
MVFMGAISYGFYLYQDAVIFCVRSVVGQSVSLRLSFVPDFALTALLAIVSFYVVEKPVIARARVLLEPPFTRLQKKAVTHSTMDLAVQEEALEIPGGAA